MSKGHLMLSSSKQAIYQEICQRQQRGQSLAGLWPITSWLRLMNQQDWLDTGLLEEDANSQRLVNIVVWALAKHENQG